jgi:putative aldouronate transport system permease protein
MLLPGLAYIIIFHYLPMVGVIISFKDYQIFKGIWDSPWVGLDNFRMLFNSQKFYEVFRNTLLISIYKIIFGFPAPIILAVLINEVQREKFRRTIQTVVYLPHFISWIVAAGLIMALLSPTDGVVNTIIKAFGGEPIFFMGNPKYFRSILVISDIWKEMGWGAIIYLAAFAGVPVELHEAAVLDGANKLQRIRHVSIPYIMPTIMIMFLLRIGGILNAGFEQVFSLYNPAVYSVGDIIDTYVYRVGLIETRYSFSTAVGFFKSIIACILVLTANSLVRRTGGESLF